MYLVEIIVPVNNNVDPSLITYAHLSPINLAQIFWVKKNKKERKRDWTQRERGEIPGWNLSNNK